jgi:hypothetical protein
MWARTILTALLAFTTCLAVHIAWWRVRRPCHDVAAVIALFLTPPVLLVPLAAALARAGVALPFGLEGGAVVAAGLLDVALACAYIQSYPAAQAVSPSLDLILAVGSAAAGLSREDILARWNSGGLVQSRIEDLEANAFIERQGDRFALTPIGRGLARFFAGYRRALGLRRTGG